MSANLPMFPPPPFYQTGCGIASSFGTIIPPGSRHCFVRSTGAQSGDPEDVVNRLLPTLSAALSECRSGLNDYIFVLPGHTENVSTATFLSGLVANTNIIGVGNPAASNAPKFTWTATAGNWAVNVNNVFISNLKLSCDGANGITSAITVTGTGCTIANNYIVWASGAALKSAIGLTVDTGALDFTFQNNYVTGTATHNVTNGVLVQGATVPSRLRILGNTMMASATAANGLVHVTVAALNCQIQGNTIANTHTSSTACIAVDAVAASGIICDNYVSTLNDGTANAQGITLGAGSLFRAFQNFSSDEANKSGVITPAVVAT